MAIQYERRPQVRLINWLFLLVTTKKAVVLVRNIVWYEVPDGKAVTLWVTELRKWRRRDVQELHLLLDGHSISPFEEGEAAIIRYSRWVRGKRPLHLISYTNLRLTGKWEQYKKYITRPAA